MVCPVCRPGVGRSQPDVAKDMCAADASPLLPCNAPRPGYRLRRLGGDGFQGIDLLGDQAEPFTDRHSPLPDLGHHVTSMVWTA